MTTQADAFREMALRADHLDTENDLFASLLRQALMTLRKYADCSTYCSRTHHTEAAQTVASIEGELSRPMRPTSARIGGLVAEVIALQEALDRMIEVASGCLGCCGDYRDIEHAESILVASKRFLAAPLTPEGTAELNAMMDEMDRSKLLSIGRNLLVVALSRQTEATARLFLHELYLVGKMRQEGLKSAQEDAPALNVAPGPCLPAGREIAPGRPVLAGAGQGNGRATK